jgi:predicted aconitase with swiveling domain
MSAIKGHPGIGPKVRGTALVATDGFSARYDLDREAGTFSRPSHKLFGRSYVDRILVLDHAKGGVATAWMMHEMVAAGRAPKALLLNFANPVMAQGMALAGIALVDRFERDITTAIPDGAEVEVDPETGTVRLLSAGSGSAPPAPAGQ